MKTFSADAAKMARAADVADAQSGSEEEDEEENEEDKPDEPPEQVKPGFLGGGGQSPLVSLLLLFLLLPPFFPIIIFCVHHLVTSISLHMQWPLTSQSHGSKPLFCRGDQGGLIVLGIYFVIRVTRLD
jgi:hypothetical protein